MAVTFVGAAGQDSITQATSFTITIRSDVVAGDDLYVLALSRGHASGTAKYTCTDNDTGGNTLKMNLI